MATIAQHADGQERSFELLVGWDDCLFNIPGTRLSVDDHVTAAVVLLMNIEIVKMQQKRVLAAENREACLRIGEGRRHSLSELIRVDDIVAWVFLSTSLALMWLSS